MMFVDEFFVEIEDDFREFMDLNLFDPNEAYTREDLDSILSSYILSKMS